MADDVRESLAEAARYAEVSRMMEEIGTSDSDFIDLGSKYVAALEARDRALLALERADATVRRRETELRAAFEQLTGEVKSSG